MWSLLTFGADPGEQVPWARVECRVKWGYTIPVLCTHSVQAHFKKLSRCKVSRKRLSEESTDGPAPQEERRKDVIIGS